MNNKTDIVSLFFFNVGLEYELQLEAGGVLWAFVRAFVRACVRACVRVCVRACMCVCSLFSWVFVLFSGGFSSTCTMFHV